MPPPSLTNDCALLPPLAMAEEIVRSLVPSPRTMVKACDPATAVTSAKSEVFDGNDAAVPTPPYVTEPELPLKASVAAIEPLSLFWIVPSHKTRPATVSLLPARSTAAPAATVKLDVLGMTCEAPRTRAPAATVVAPPYALPVLESVSVPAPLLVKGPAPEMAAVTFKASAAASVRRTSSTPLFESVPPPKVAAAPPPDLIRPPSASVSVLPALGVKLTPLPLRFNDQEHEVARRRGAGGQLDVIAGHDRIERRGIRVAAVTHRSNGSGRRIGDGEIGAR